MTSPIDVGHAIFALHDPHPGQERAFNEWYERDHMYLGGVLAPWTIAGVRWVATARLKSLRFPAEGPFGPVAAGSYLASYWIQKGRLADQQSWVASTLASGVGASFGEKSVQTATTYDRVGDWQRGADGVPPFLALAHGYAGLGWLILERAPDTSVDALADWLFRDYAPRRWAKSAAGLAIAFAPRPKEAWWPASAPEVAGVGDRLAVACFLETDPATCWNELFVPLAKDIAGKGRVLFAAPFLPTVPGTHKYTNQLRA